MLMETFRFEWINFSQPSEIDGLNRELGIWFPAGGKAHAYNIMGTKYQN